LTAERSKVTEADGQGHGELEPPVDDQPPPPLAQGDFGVEVMRAQAQDRPYTTWPIKPMVPVKKEGSKR